MEVSIEIESYDNMLEYAMLDVSQIQVPMEKEFGPNLIIRHNGRFVRKGLGLPDILRYIATIRDVTTGMTSVLVLTDWLYKKLKGKASKLTIDGIDVRMEEGEIKRVLIDKIEM